MLKRLGILAKWAIGRNWKSWDGAQKIGEPLPPAYRRTIWTQFDDIQGQEAARLHNLIHDHELWTEKEGRRALSMAALEKIRMSALHPHISNIPMDAEAVKKFNKAGKSIEYLNEAMRDFLMPGRSFYSWASPKVTVCLMLVRMIVHDLKEKVVIMTQNNKAQMLLSLLLKKANYRVVSLDAGVSMEVRGAMARSFDETGMEGPNIFLSTYQLGGEAIDLYRRCRIVLAVSLAWNFDKTMQALGRVLQLDGSTRPVLLIELCLQRSLDSLFLAEHRVFKTRDEDKAHLLSYLL